MRNDKATQAALTLARQSATRAVNCLPPERSDYGQGLLVELEAISGTGAILSWCWGAALFSLRENGKKNMMRWPAKALGWTFTTLSAVAAPFALSIAASLAYQGAPETAALFTIAAVLTLISAAAVRLLVSRGGRGAGRPWLLLSLTWTWTAALTVSLWLFLDVRVLTTDCESDRRLMPCTSASTPVTTAVTACAVALLLVALVRLYRTGPDLVSIAALLLSGLVNLPVLNLFFPQWIGALQTYPPSLVPLAWYAATVVVLLVQYLRSRARTSPATVAVEPAHNPAT